MDHSKQLRPPLQLLLLLLLLLLLCCSLSKGFKVVGPPANRTDLRESCPHQFVALFDSDNYILVENDTAVWILGQYFNVSYYDNFSRPVICTYVIYPPSFSKTVVITAVSITSLSILASVVLLITYTLFPSLRTFPSKVIMNLAAAFLAGDVCYIVTASLLFHNKTDKLSISVVVQSYFYYARFMWMALAGFEMCRNIYNGLQLKVASKTEKKKILLVYVLLGWGVPLLLAVILAAVQFTNNQSKHLFGIGGYIIALVPISLMLFFNVGIVIFLSFMLHNAALNRKKLKGIVKRRNTIFVRVFLIILTVLGFPWVLVFIFLFEIESGSTDVLVILFVLLNTSQPLVVSTAFIGTKKVMQEYLSFFGCKREDRDTTASSGRQSRVKRLMSTLCASRDLEDSAQQQGRESNEDNVKHNVMSLGTLCVTKGGTKAHGDDSGLHE